MKVKIKAVVSFTAKEAEILASIIDQAPIQTDDDRRKFVEEYAETMHRIRYAHAMPPSMPRQHAKGTAK